MGRLSRTGIAALAAVVSMLTPGVVAAAPASGVSVLGWNCRQVIANDITFFASSTGSATAYPHRLVYGDRFRSYGGYDGRYRAETAGPSPSKWGYWGYTTSDSRWVTQVPDYRCQTP